MQIIWLDTFWMSSAYIWYHHSGFIANYIVNNFMICCALIFKAHLKNFSYKFSIKFHLTSWNAHSASSNGYDAILTIVDHGCSWVAIFIPCHMTITGPQIAQKYFQHIYPWFGIPDKVISNRNSWFTSHFGQGLARELGVTQNIFTAFHPQTNGLTEWTNQWLEQYLWLVTAH